MQLQGLQKQEKALRELGAVVKDSPLANIVQIVKMVGVAVPEEPVHQPVDPTVETEGTFHLH